MSIFFLSLGNGQTGQAVFTWSSAFLDFRFRFSAECTVCAYEAQDNFTTFFLNILWNRRVLHKHNQHILLNRKRKSIYVGNLKLQKNVKSQRAVSRPIPWSNEYFFSRKWSDWASCLHLKLGVPRWLMTTSICMGIIFLLWLCLVIPSNAPKQRVKATATTPDIITTNPKEIEANAKKVKMIFFIYIYRPSLLKFGKKYRWLGGSIQQIWILFSCHLCLPFKELSFSVFESLGVSWASVLQWGTQ